MGKGRRKATSARCILPLRSQWALSGDISGCQHLGGTTDIWIAKDAASHPIMHRTASHSKELCGPKMSTVPRSWESLVSNELSTPLSMETGKEDSLRLQSKQEMGHWLVTPPMLLFADTSLVYCHILRCFMYWTPNPLLVLCFCMSAIHSYLSLNYVEQHL